MPSRQVSGLALPQKVAHHPALELCNTRAWWGSAAPTEYLLSWQHAAVLAHDLQLVNAAAADPGASAATTHVEQAALERVIGLRTDLYAAVTGAATAAGIGRLDTAMAAGRRDLRFRGYQDGAPLWVPREAGAEGVVHAFSRSAGDLLGVPRRVGVCPRCGWTFLDPSGRRKWCSMKWCGNRDKVEQFARRARSGREDGPR